MTPARVLGLYLFNIDVCSLPLVSTFKAAFLCLCETRWAVH